MPKVGQHVLVQRGLGQNVILQYFPVAVSSSTEQNTTYSTGGSPASPAATRSGSANFRGRMPSDLHQGDSLLLGNDGQFIKMDEGGGMYFQSAPFAKVETHTENNLVRVWGKNTELHSAFGQIKFSELNGKSSFAFEGGTDYQNETGMGKKNWRVRALIGGNASGLVDYTISDRMGSPVYRTVIAENGDVTEFSTGSRAEEYAGPVTGTYRQGRTTVVSGRDENLTVTDGNHTETCGGTRALTASQNLDITSMNDISTFTNRDLLFSVGRNAEYQIAGNTLAIPGDDALAYSVYNGSVTYNIGLPPLDYQKSQSSFNVNVMGSLGKIGLTTFLGGNISLSTLVPATIALNTQKPDGVVLGGVAGFAAFHAAKFEMLELLLNTLITYIDSHVHPVLSQYATSLPPVTPSSPFLSPLIPPIKSIFVTIGA